MGAALKQLASKDDAPDRGIGADLRALRKSRSVTLAELALAIGRSVGFVSQVERGISQPSIADLRAIARVLGVPVSWFFNAMDDSGKDRGHVVRAGSRRALGTAESGIVEELLSPDLGGSFEVFRSVFQPLAEITDPIMRETEEAGFIVSGTLRMWIGERQYDLQAGDSFRFAHEPYRWHNTGTEPAIVIWVVSPPVY